MSDDVYLRKDVYDAHMEAIRALMAESEARHREYMARQDAQIAEIRAEGLVYRADSKRESESLASDIKSIRDRLDSLERGSSLRWTVIGSIAAVIGAFLAVIPYLSVIIKSLGV